MKRIVIANGASVPGRLFGHRRRELERIGNIGLSLIAVGGIAAILVGFSVGSAATVSHCGVRVGACSAVDADLNLWLVYIAGIGTSFVGFLLIVEVNAKLKREPASAYVVRGGQR